MARDLQSRVVILADDKTGAAFQSVAAKLNTLANAAKQVKAVTEQVGAMKSAMAAAVPADRIAIYRQTAKQTLELARAHQTAQAQFKAAARDMNQIGPPTQAMVQRYQQLREQLQGTGRALNDQKAVMSAARTAMREAGIDVTRLTSEQRRLAAATKAASDAQSRQHQLVERRANRREVIGTAAGLAGVAAARAGKHLAGSATTSVAEFDIAVRKQREFTDIPVSAQSRLLIPQAKRIGQETQFTNLDIVKAQTKAMQGLPSTITGELKAEIAHGFIENVKNYALVMEADMEKSAEAIRAYLQTTNQDISTKDKALAAANKATNQLVKMAKLGGMNDEDVQQFLKYAASSGTTAGLSPESLMSIAALARRGGLRGDEAGVFMRTASSKLVSPTKDGIAALNAAGIDYSKYVRMPGQLDVGGLENQFRNSMGVSFKPQVRGKLDAIMNDPTLIGDRGKFVEAVTSAVEEQFGKTKKGTMRPADRVNVAKAARKFHELSAKSVDAEGLLDRVMESDMTLAQLNKFFTDKHGGKGAITQRQREEYVASRKQLREAGDDPDFAKRKADAIMGGVGGSFEQAKGAVDNFILSVGTANERLIKFGLDGFSDVLGSFEKLSTGGQQAATALGAIAAVGGGIYGTAKLLGLLTGGGSAAALTGSAAALDLSAAALTAAAAKLSGGAIPDLPGGNKTGAKGKLGIGSMALIAGTRLLPAGALGYGFYDLLSGGDLPVTADSQATAKPGEAHNEGRKRLRRANDLRRERMDEFTRDQKVELDGTAEVKVDLNVKLDMGLLRSEIQREVRATGHLSAGGSTAVGSTGKTMPEASGGGGGGGGAH